MKSNASKQRGETASSASHTVRARIERVRELERDVEFVAEVRRGVEAGRRGKSVRFRDLKRRNA